jgi:hypothetical protein
MHRTKPRSTRSPGAGPGVWRLATGLIYLTIGDGPAARYAWLAIMLALIVAMKLLPARVAEQA